MDPGFYVIDIDGTLVTSDSDFKQGAAATYKKGFGFYPMMSYLDATGEPLAGKLRPGNAGSGTATDYVEVLDASLTQLPVSPADHEVIARSDSAGCSHDFLNACRERMVRFCVGHPLTEAMALAVTRVSGRQWIPAVTADGTDLRDGAEVAEITHLVDLSGWPTGTRAIARREDPHPGAQLTFTDIDGHRYQVFLTDLADPDVCYLEGIYRGRGRCECYIRDAKDTGLANLPSADFAINQAWVTVVLLAGDLLAQVRSLCLEGELARAEPKRLRYCLLHAAGVLVRSGRRTTLRIADRWPWAEHLVAAFGPTPQLGRHLNGPHFRSIQPTHSPSLPGPHRHQQRRPRNLHRRATPGHQHATSEPHAHLLPSTTSTSPRPEAYCKAWASTTCSRPRVIATWRTRRSSSSS